MKRSVLLPVVVLVGFASAAAGRKDAAYVSEITTWRKAHEAELMQSRGWLSLVGLSWLKEGENTLGSGEGFTISLPKPAPRYFGRIIFKDGKITLEVPKGLALPLSISGQSTAYTGEPATFDLSGGDSTVTYGSITFVIIKRGSRTGVRIWDSESPVLKAFKGEKWYPISEGYRIAADYTPYATPKKMPILNVLGDTTMVPNPGFVTFKLNGQTVRLEAEAAGDGFFFNFRDATCGVTTYHAGRFLDASAPKDGKVILDFNKATSPPCAFTAYATCPLPPKGNVLKVRIPAGEQYVHPDIEE